MRTGSSILAIAQGDAVALTMMALLGFALGMILTILIVMARHAGRKPDVTGELEGDEDDATPRTRAGEPPAEPRDEWEREPDWWKDR
ncbi:MAG: hypothetical protein HKN82_19495 [Akkermansiaceae bacterium]|nr:hypothetical protein [Akkermansiaceae bacterium]NNM28516.1 hypothetical protein [Akkermansiaceae bacterium]